MKWSKKTVWTSVNGSYIVEIEKYSNNKYLWHLMERDLCFGAPNPYMDPVCIARGSCDSLSEAKKLVTMIINIKG